MIRVLSRLANFGLSGNYVIWLTLSWFGFPEAGSDGTHLDRLWSSTVIMRVKSQLYRDDGYPKYERG